MRAIDLFSGIGGFALAGKWCWGERYEILSFCEFDRKCQELLSVRFPGVPIHPNVKDFDGTKFADVDLVTGGFPCQPFSVAGKQEGTEDDRYLWLEMLAVIHSAKPRWVIAENVYGLITWNDGVVLETVLSDLETEGYAVQAFIIPACAKGARHQRYRVWIVANNDQVRCNARRTEQPLQGSGEYGKTLPAFTPRIEGERTARDKQETCSEQSGEIRRDFNRLRDRVTAHSYQSRIGTRRRGTFGNEQTDSEKRQHAQSEFTGHVATDDTHIRRNREWRTWNGWERLTNSRCRFNQAQPGQNGLVYGLSNWLDRYLSTESGISWTVSTLKGHTHRIHQLGNAIVPQVAYEIMRAIRDSEK